MMAVTVSPNPASDNLLGSVPASQTAGVKTEDAVSGTSAPVAKTGGNTARVKIFNVSRTLEADLRYPTPLQQVQLSVKGLVPGTYFVEVTSSDYRTTTKKVIVQHGFL